MTIKKRIFYSNTFMVLSSLLILLAVGGGLISLFKSEFLNWYGETSQLSEYTYEAWEVLQDAEAYGGDWEGLDKDLSKYGFRLSVSAESDKKYYYTLRYREWEGVEAILNAENKAGKIDTYFIENVTILTTTCEIDGRSFDIYAASAPEGISILGMDWGMFDEFLIVFLVIGVLSIAGILLCSQIFTRYLIKEILRPVNELDVAAKRIDSGDLTIPICYQTEDEFKGVCDSFDMMQEHLREGMEKNAAYERARTEMVSGISHDLRTPLTSVKGYIKGMMDGIANTEEKQKQYLEIAYQKSCDMDVLLSKLFYFSRLETGNMPFFRQKTEMVQFLQRYVTERQRELEMKDVEILFEGNGLKESYCSVDKEQFERVCNNLVENSMKYNGREEGLCIRIELEHKEEKLQITFSDNGSGVPQEKLSHIFEQFYRGDESRNSKCDGNGLGLYVCRYIIKEHGGMIRAYNENGLHIQMVLPEMKGCEG